MNQTPREIVRRTLRFEHPQRLARDLWALPWANEHLSSTLAELNHHYPSDISRPADVYNRSSRKQGDMFAVGTYIDEWGCLFNNIHAGVIGEVKTAQLSDLSQWQQIKPPYETLPDDLTAARDQVNRSCAASDKFMLANCCPRPWERLQFLRGTVEAMIDVMENSADLGKLLKLIHDFYLRELEFWVSTDVDAIMFMDDWGSQLQLLIPPPVWRQLFKPLYRDYCELAHRHGKFAFMHSDGQIMEIYPDLIEIGVDAINSQLFCMDMAQLARIGKGKITFWGEIDRQQILPALDPQHGRNAVRQVARELYDPAGGIIAQFEIGPGTCGATALAVMQQWQQLDQEERAGITNVSPEETRR